MEQPGQPVFKPYCPYIVNMFFKFNFIFDIVNMKILMTTVKSV